MKLAVKAFKHGRIVRCADSNGQAHSQWVLVIFKVLDLMMSAFTSAAFPCAENAIVEDICIVIDCSTDPKVVSVGTAILRSTVMVELLNFALAGNPGNVNTFMVMVPDTF